MEIVQGGIGRGLVFVVCAPSGGGKTTLVRQTMARLASHGITGHFSVSHTTRARRPAETDGRDYHFVDRETFDAMIADGQFLEWAEYAGNLYGTSRAAVEERLAAGEDVYLDIEVQGAAQVRTQLPDAVSVFIYPPSFTVLRQRLTDRGQDPADAIARRLRWAAGELEVADEFEYAIINDRLDQAVDALFGICLAEHLRYHRLRPRLQAIRQTFAAALSEDPEQ